MSNTFGTGGQIIVDGSGVPQLAPDLTFPSSLQANASHVNVTGIDATGALTTLLELTGGKFILNLFIINGLTSENITIKMTVDNVVIMNDTFVIAGNTFRLSGGNDATASSYDAFACEDNLKIELQTATDINISFEYLARPLI